MPIQHYYEHRLYSFTSAAHRAVFGAFVEKVLVPTYARLGIGPIGVFAGVYGPDNATLHVIIPHEDVQSSVAIWERLLKDPDFVAAGESILGRNIDEASHYRYESRLLRAFTGMPGIELPDGNLERANRIFEIRCYESHSERAAAKKREMFNEGGEIELFRRTGLSPVLFGQTVFGPRMPNLLYMLTFDDMAHRDRAWDVFKDHPEWAALSGDPQYADTVSTITDLILVPAFGSQM